MRLPSVKDLIWPAILCAAFVSGTAGGVLLARRHVAMVARQQTAADTPISDIQLDDVTLGKLVDAINAKCPGKVRVDWADLATEQVTPQTRLYCDLRVGDAEVGPLLRTCLWAQHGIRVFEADGEIHVNANGPPTVIRNYEIGDLLRSVDMSNAWWPENAWGIQSSAEGYLRDSLAWMVDPPGGFIYSRPTWPNWSITSNQLIVTGPLDLQQRLRDLLAEIRTAAAQKGPIRRSHMSFENDPLLRQAPAEDFRGMTMASAVRRLEDITGAPIVVTWIDDKQDPTHMYHQNPQSVVLSALPNGRLGMALRKLFKGQQADDLREQGASVNVPVGSSDGVVYVRGLPGFTAITRFYPFADTSEHRAVLSMHSELTNYERWPGWIVLMPEDGNNAIDDCDPSELGEMLDYH
jgi:hypothetical protein